MIIACNKIDLKGAYDNYLRLKDQFKEYMMVPCSAESELALREANRKELISYIAGEHTFSITNESKLSETQKKALHFRYLRIQKMLRRTCSLIRID